MNQLRLQPGERFYAGYHEWIVTPLEAEVLRVRGYAIVDGLKFRATEVCPNQFRIEGLPGDVSDPQCAGLREGLTAMRRHAMATSGWGKIHGAHKSDWERAA